jgi:hypothetical protein
VIVNMHGRTTIKNVSTAIQGIRNGMYNLFLKMTSHPTASMQILEKI